MRAGRHRLEIWTLGFENERGSRGIIGIRRDRPVADSHECLREHEERDEEPFPRRNRIAESVLERDVEPRGFKELMEQLLEPDTIDVVQQIAVDHLYIREEISRVEPGVPNAAWYLAACNPNFMNQV